MTTEHLDFHNPYDNFNDNIPNFVLYEAELKKLEQEFNRSILRGLKLVMFQHMISELMNF